MEMLILLKANIRKKKGTFISIAILMAIVVTICTSIISVRDNYLNGLNRAFEMADCGEILIFIDKKTLTDELRSTMENSSLVKQIKYYDSIVTSKVIHNENGEKHKEENSYFLTTLRDGIALYNKELTAFCKDIPALGEGEIYLPLGLKSKLECDVEDIITLEVGTEFKKDFVIKGFVQEPMLGSSTMGWKQVFIGKSDFQEWLELCSLSHTNVQKEFVLISIYQAEGSTLSPSKFQKQLNLETKILDMADGGMNIEQSQNYTTLLPDMILDIVFTFMLFLFLIILIVVSHSITTEIDIEYTTLGILKAQGFNNKKIRAIFLIQYMVSLLLGAMLGSIVAIPIQYYIGKACMSVTAVLPEQSLSIGKSSLFTLILIGCFCLIILLKTRKVIHISPVRAIIGGVEDIYFDSRIYAPIFDKALSFWLAFRQLISAKKRYLSVLFIVVILTFFMTLVNLFSVFLGSRDTLNSMGLMIPDITFHYNKDTDKDLLTEVEKIVEKHAAIQYKNQQRSQYISLNGDKIYSEMYKYPEQILALTKGRIPLYDNEILITQIVSESMDLEIGDTVILSKNDKEVECMITGFYQTPNDMGMVIAFNFDLAGKLDLPQSGFSASFIVQDKDKISGIIDEIEAQYGELLNVNDYTTTKNPIEIQYHSIVGIITVIIYSFSILFALIVVIMVCNKTFIRERRDIGIFKALGFTVHKLRLHFALRFFILALLGSFIGMSITVAIAKPTMSFILKFVGLSTVIVNFTVASVLLPILIISGSFFIFAYMASKNIKKVEVKELIVQ